MVPGSETQGPRRSRWPPRRRARRSPWRQSGVRQRRGRAHDTEGAGARQQFGHDLAVGARGDDEFRAEASGRHPVHGDQERPRGVVIRTAAGIGRWHVDGERHTTAARHDHLLVVAAGDLVDRRRDATAVVVDVLGDIDRPGSCRFDGGVGDSARRAIRSAAHRIRDGDDPDGISVEPAAGSESAGIEHDVDLRHHQRGQDGIVGDAVEQVVGRAVVEPDPAEDLPPSNGSASNASAIARTRRRSTWPSSTHRSPRSS